MFKIEYSPKKNTHRYRLVNKHTCENERFSTSERRNK